MNENKSRFVCSLRDTLNPSKCIDVCSFDQEELRVLFESFIDDFNATRSSDFSTFTDYIDSLNMQFSRIFALSDFLKEVENVQDTVRTD